jgi:hydrogenase nickel incorporation protein HypA/HybF
MSLAVGILEIAEEESRRLGGARVTAIRLKLGPLAGVVKEALEFSFEVARESTPLTDAVLKIEDGPVTTDCPACGGLRTVRSIQDRRCADCGTPAVRIAGGDELEVTGIEIEEPAEPVEQPI